MKSDSKTRMHKPRRKAKKWPEKMKLSQAHKFLGISFGTLSNLVGRGILAVHDDPLDRRVKLVKRSDLEEILRMRKQSS